MYKEKQDFLLRCETEDRKKLQHETKMDLATFQRLVFLADYFGYDCYEKEIWNEFSGDFLEELKQEKEPLTEWELQRIREEREGWIQAFMGRNE